MYSVSEDFLNQIKADDREFSVKLIFTAPTDRELTGTTIKSISVDETVNSAETLTLGCACSNKITVSLIEPPTDIDYGNAVFTAYVGLKTGDEYEDVPLGKFYVTDVETSNDFKTLTLTAYDGFCKMSGKYNATVSEDTTIQAVYDDLKVQLKEKCGITLQSWTFTPIPFKFPYLDITYQQAIGYIAGCFGGFARFNRYGILGIAIYNKLDIEIDQKLQYMGGFKKLTDKPLTITSVKTGTQEKPLVFGEGVNGTEIAFENPYITVGLANQVFIKFEDFTYTPCQIKWRGNPAIQAGDIVKAIDGNGIEHTVLVMSQQIKIGGGLSATIDCKGKSQTTSAFSNKFEPVGQKLDRIYKTLEQQILDATNAITGNKGGYVILNDTNNDGKPDEILVMDTDNTDTATKVWRWNKEGLGYAYNPDGNAYAGPYRIAITADGQINADFITTGTLNAERIAVETHDNVTGLLTDYIRFGDGTITLGKGSNAVILKLENDQIAFYSGTKTDENGQEISKKMAWFTNNSFEIEELDRFRIGNFGYILRGSGNLTFTKLI